MSNIWEDPVVEQLKEELLRKGVTVSTAESCTGGMVGMTLTALAGSSAYFKGGILSYSNECKEALLHVSHDDLERVGAVSEEVGRAMAEGARAQLGTDYSIVTTGIAGPGGATETKPVGLVYIGIGTPKGTKVYRHVFEGNRHEVRQASTIAGITHLLYILQEQ